MPRCAVFMMSLLFVTGLAAACGGGGTSSPGADAGKDVAPTEDVLPQADEQTPDAFRADVPPPGGCDFPYTAPVSRRLESAVFGTADVLDRHLRCSVRYGDVDAEIFLVAVPTGWVGFEITYAGTEAYVCRGGEVEALAEGDFSYAVVRDGWQEMAVAFGGRRYVFGYGGEMCVGERPCTWSFVVFDVEEGGRIVASNQPTTCAGVGVTGVPLPLVPFARVPAEGDDITPIPFTRGSADGDADERPMQEVDFRPFWLDVREATNADFAPFLTENGNECEGHPCVDPEGAGFGLRVEGGVWTPRPGAEDLPVVHVTAFGAAAYCEWRGGALPSEIEWEAAASAAGTRKYPWSDAAPDCDHALYDACAATGPAAVCTHTAGDSREGLSDLAGNVEEWLASYYQADFYSTCAADDSCGRGPANDTGLRAVRGGSYARAADELRAAGRRGLAPETTAADLGLRCRVR